MRSWQLRPAPQALSFLTTEAGCWIIRGNGEVLPEIAASVKGKIKIFVDDGIRSGVDALQMLAWEAEQFWSVGLWRWRRVGGGREV